MLLISVCAALCTTTYFLSTRATLEICALPATTIDSDNLSNVQNSLENQLAALEQENSDLKKTIDLLLKNPTLNHSKPAIGHEVDTTEPQDKNSKEISEHYKIFKRTEELSKYISSLPDSEPTALYRDLDSKFASEPIDYNWSYDYEEKLHDLFANNELLKNSIPEVITCKTNKCQIKFRISDSEQANQVTANFADKLHSSELDINKVEVIAASDLNQGLLSLYVTRNSELKAYE